MLVFVSYRREDSADATDRLAASLRERLGRERVFLDVDNIDIGARFATVVDEWVGRCDVLLAVIGRDWVSATGSDGGRRLDDPGDYVRLEVEAAIARDVRVVPVLIHDARIPAAEELPESLAPLVDYNAIELTRRHWDTDVQHLIDGLERIVGAEAPRRGRGRARGVGIPSTGAQTRSERRDRSGRSGAGRRGRVLLALAVAAVALAAGVLATLGLGGGKHAPQPPALRLAATIGLGFNPVAVTIEQDDLWVAGGSGVTLLSPGSGKPVESIADPLGPSQLVTGAGSVWVANTFARVPVSGGANPDGSVSRIDPRTLELTGSPTRVGYGADTIAVGLGSVWVASAGSHTVTRIDPASGRVLSQAKLGASVFPTCIVAGLGAVWVCAGEQILRIDPRTGRPAGSPIADPYLPSALAAGAGRLWVANEAAPVEPAPAKAHDHGSLIEIDPRSGNQLGGAVAVGAEPEAIAVGLGSVWVVNGAGNSVTQVNPATRTVVGAPIGVGRSPNAIAIGFGSVWVTSAQSATISRYRVR